MRANPEANDGVFLDMNRPVRLDARRAAWSAVLIVLCAAAVPSLAVAASPAPAASPLDSFNGVEIWLDADFVVPDAPPGGVLEAGFTLWFERQSDFFELGGFEARMLPAKGTAAPSVATLESDFPGHVIANFVVPEGGPGPIEVGVRGQACHQDGTCTDDLTPIAIAGTGPPPDADPRLLVAATIHPFVGDVVTGRATPVTVEIQPRGLWDRSALPLPEHLLVAAGRRGEPPVATAEIRPTGTGGNPYTGRLTMPEAGEFALTVAIPGPDGVDRTIDGSAFAVTVIEGGPGESASPSAADPTAPAETSQETGVPQIIWIVGIGIVLVAAAVVLRRVLADL